jgi:chromosome segregation ATPase
MAKNQTDTDNLRERLTGLLADWGAEMSMLLRQLEETQAELGELKSSSEGHEKKLKQLEDRAAGQADLIDTLKADAEEAGALRDEVRARDLEVERLKSEVESKQELVRALRRDAEGADRLKAEAKKRDLKISEQQEELDRAGRALAGLREELASANESSENEAAQEHAELEALKAELEARKTLIKSLRADSGRVESLQEQLEAKRETIAALEDSINRHVETISELKRSGEIWKKKYQAAKAKGADATATDLPAFTATEADALKQLEATVGGGAPDRTVAIDMRQPLSEARRKAAESGRG